MPLNVEDKFADMSSRRKRVYACALILWASDCRVVKDHFHPFTAEDVKKTHMKGIHVWEEGARQGDSSRSWDEQLQVHVSSCMGIQAVVQLSESVSVSSVTMYRMYERQKPYYSAFKQCVKKRVSTSNDGSSQNW